MRIGRLPRTDWGRGGQTRTPKYPLLLYNAILCIILIEILVQHYFLQWDTVRAPTPPPSSDGVSMVTLHTPASTCYRPCKTYDNIIVFEGMAKESAGLYDRQFAIQACANFAAYLCARLVVPSPHIMLAEKHNYGERVSIDLTWQDDFFDVILLADGSSAIIQLDNINNLESSSSSHWPNATVIGKRDDLKQAFSKARSLVQHDTPFLWKIAGGYEDGYENVILPEIKKLGKTTEGGILPFNCEAAKMVPSSIVQSTTAKVLERLPASAFGYLHLRRGDSKNACNTSVAKVREYFACSMNGTMAPSNFTMVLATEERSEEYLNGIKEVLELNGFHYEHLDAIVNDALEQQVIDGWYDRNKLNNHLTFKIGIGVAKQASLYLEQRRKFSCHDCSPWLTEHLQKIAASSL
jgi:hypothetical protein